MIELDVTTDNRSGLAGMISGLNSQLPYAYSRALNATANDAQAAIQHALPSEFTLRQPTFITQSIYRTPGEDFATKTKLEATVRVNPARNFLAKFEDGGAKTSQGGRSLAVPILRENNRELIIKRGDPLSVKRLMDSIQSRSGRVLRARVRKGVLTVSADANKVFLVQSAKGTFIVQRTGSGPRDTRVLYAFERSVPIKPQLHFDEIAMRAALQFWDRNFAEALEDAIATAR
ncbi:MAG TPA: hypothetical protein VH539_20390 [Gemmatimonadaceae bacterium]|jgi:hypothetical protein